MSNILCTVDKNRKVHWKFSLILTLATWAVYSENLSVIISMHQKHSRDYFFFNFSIVTQKRKVGTIAPKKFIARLRKEKIEFDNYMQQVRKYKFW